MPRSTRWRCACASWGRRSWYFCCGDASFSDTSGTTCAACEIRVAERLHAGLAYAAMVRP
ncbi:protein of unknown function [Azospirillum lipoferum 4B]|uniref:Uncharacterized protein n=1 Tax=Azospirillum lipoferum (strain 4B) TaxID=862719 RepID=G7Z789_AZOL4|nr:protein of unknown function [Azospirillum lipoferum 4B]